jgi:hypothetical protein
MRQPLKAASITVRTVLLTAAALAAVVGAPAARAAPPAKEIVYADGKTYEMLGTRLITNASGGLLQAPPIYVIEFSVPGASGAITLPSGYQPQCNPCDVGPRYHDHVLAGAPGLGTNGTAGDYAAPWRIVLMHYNPEYSNRPDFQPITSDEQIPQAESEGKFLQINPGAADPYQDWTSEVLICPVIRPHGRKSATLTAVDDRRLGRNDDGWDLAVIGA